MFIRALVTLPLDTDVYFQFVLIGGIAFLCCLGLGLAGSKYRGKAIVDSLVVGFGGVFALTGLSLASNKYYPGSAAAIFSLIGLALLIGGVLHIKTMRDELMSKMKADEEQREAEQARYYREHPERMPDEMKTPLQRVADAWLIDRVESPMEPNFGGYKLITGDSSPKVPDNDIQAAARQANLAEARQQGRLFGNPGGGLDSSTFNQNEISSGKAGEQMLARMIVSSCPNVVSFWSVYGLDDHGRKIDADIDCIILGMDLDGVVHAWFVDAKNYKGGNRTMYVNLDEDTLIRIVPDENAFLAGVNGHPDMKMSRNMINQYQNWLPYLTRYRIDDRWDVCFVPVGDNGAPQTCDTYWPGGIKAVRAEELVNRIKNMQLVYPANIPYEIVEFFKRHVKPAGRRHSAQSSTPDEGQTLE